MISVAVMAHPKREKFVPSLVEAIDADVEVVWDQINNRWDTGRRALLAHDPEASHHLVVQDDAIVPRDLVRTLDAALRWVPPESPVSLYVGNVRPHRDKIRRLVAEAGDASWLTMNKLLWGVGVVVPTRQISSVVEFGDRRKRPKNYDLRISSWYEHHGLDVWYSWPSLVDHRPVKENPSLVHGRTANRQAHRFVGENRSALKVNWSGSVVHLEVE